MKLGAIKKICERNKSIYIVTRPDGSQWIGNGYAYYPVDGVHLSERNIPVIFDIDEGKRAKYLIQEIDCTAETDEYRLDVHPMRDIEAICETCPGCIWHREELYRILLAEEGVYLINVAHLKPLEGKGTYHEFYVRRREGERPVIACYGDMLVSAIISPVSKDRAEEIIAGVTGCAGRAAAETAATGAAETGGAAKEAAMIGQLQLPYIVMDEGGEPEDGGEDELL